MGEVLKKERRKKQTHVEGQRNQCTHDEEAERERERRGGRGGLPTPEPEQVRQQNK